MPKYRLWINAKLKGAQGSYSEKRDYYVHADTLWSGSNSAVEQAVKLARAEGLEHVLVVNHQEFSDPIDKGTD
jgi:hypothetical protein